MSDLSVPVFRSLTNRTMFAGIPRELFIMNLGLFLIGVMQAKLWWIVVFNLAFHKGVALACKKDPYILEVVRRYYHQKPWYLG